MHRKSWVSLLVALTLLASPLAVANPDADWSPAVVAALGELPEDSARVVFFRPWMFQGTGASFMIREGDQRWGNSRNGQYLVIEIEPGNHTFSIRSLVRADITLQLEPGRTEFVSMKFRQEGDAVWPVFVRSSAAAFNVALPKLKVTSP